MKKSEMRNKMLRAVGVRDGGPGPTPYDLSIAREAISAAEEAGVIWEPEEPELPERVIAQRYRDRPFNQNVLVALHADGEEAPCYDFEDLYREAAARYNIIGRMMRPWGLWTNDTVQRALEQEREKLA